jgi:hypothetical protein
LVEIYGIKKKCLVVWVKSNRIHAIGIGKNTQNIKLGTVNVAKNMNDYYIAKLQDYYKINLSLFCQNDLSL